MKRVPLWLLWSGLTLMVWVTAAWLVWGILAPREANLRAEEEELRRKQAEARALVVAAPYVVAQIDSVEAEIRRHLARLTTTDEITRLLSELEEEGLRHKFDAVRADLSLHSTMSIPLENEPGIEGGFAAHSLRLTLRGQGTFRAIGSWLDTVEDRADFHRWIACRWEHQPDVGRINFDGVAEFWVITPPAAESAPAEDDTE